MNNSSSWLLPPWLSPLCLVVIFFATLITEWTGYQTPAILAVLVLLIFTLVEWKNLELTTKIIAIVAIGLTLALLLTVLDIEWFAQQLAHLNINAVVIGSSPTTTSVRISSKITGITPFHMGIKWNGLYSGLVLLALDLYLIVML